MKKTIRENWRVIVIPFKHKNDSKSEESLCMEFVAKAGARIDAIAEYDIEHDTRDICSFCGKDWKETTFYDLGNRQDDEHLVGMPKCCDEAKEEWRLRDD